MSVSEMHLKPPCHIQGGLPVGHVSNVPSRVHIQGGFAIRKPPFS
jgi:hypothetical protein